MNPLLRKRQCGFVVYKVDYMVMHCLKTCVGSYCKKVKAVLHQGFFYCKNDVVLILQICEIQEFLKEGWALEPFDFGVPNRF